MYDQSETIERRREANRKLVQRYFTLQHNSPEKNDMHAPDCIWEQPYFRPGESGPIFPSENSNVASRTAEDTGSSADNCVDNEVPFVLPEGFEIPEFTPEWTWDGETRIWTTDDPDYIIAENEGHGLQLCGDGQLRSYHNHYIHTFRFRDGKIIYYREFANPLNLMDTFGCKYEPLPRPEDTIAELVAAFTQQT